ncbi:RidA family protein [Pseudomonas japonica]|uniref:Enamine deaminase RidA, house cleaning of reactive enamine intermediates, YjgF/YER057c/UK114 family n=1 Tax=Pseudomonas japonica TaxID=256466 RepID=A0A239EB84_9PSED|nr:RidA family protein [Pseudomonas japonica]SNS41741.1 Enamine deaminase RidA, house cleaning of reactive enamine intermediates, YjgF/YER057c/UK114 family [Pseudomonas japonica]
MKRLMINPPHTEELYDRLHFSQATRVGDLIWVSGQVGVDRITQAVGNGMEAQARLAFDNLKSVLEAADASMADIVELMTFHTDLRGDIQEFIKVKDEFISDRYPSWTGIGVSQLARPEFLIEIRVVAVAGSGAD